MKLSRTITCLMLTFAVSAIQASIPEPEGSALSSDNIISQTSGDRTGVLLRETPTDTAVINIGDELQILLQEDEAFQFRGPVDASGFITLNYVGDVRAANLTIGAFKAKLSEILLDQYYKKATLSVTITKRAPGFIHVYGAVKTPGAIQLIGANQISIPQILAAVEGLTTWSDPRRAYILRASQEGDPINEPVDILQSFSTLNKSEIVYLYAGDELYIPAINQDDDGQLLTTAPREVVVVGQVNAPGIQMFAPGEEATLMRAIFKAGGLNTFAQGSAVKLIRYQGEERNVQVVDVSKIIDKGHLEDDVQLNSGDMVIVPQKFINF